MGKYTKNTVSESHLRWLKPTIFFPLKVGDAFITEGAFIRINMVNGKISWGHFYSTASRNNHILNTNHFFSTRYFLSFFSLLKTFLKSNSKPHFDYFTSTCNRFKIGYVINKITKLRIKLTPKLYIQMS